MNKLTLVSMSLLLTLFCVVGSATAPTQEEISPVMIEVDGEPLPVVALKDGEYFPVFVVKGQDKPYFSDEQGKSNWLSDAKSGTEFTVSYVTKDGSYHEIKGGKISKNDFASLSKNKKEKVVPVWFCRRWWGGSYYRYSYNYGYSYPYYYSYPSCYNWYYRPYYNNCYSSPYYYNNYYSSWSCYSNWGYVINWW